MTDQTDNGAPRRIRRARKGFAFSSSSMAVATSGAGHVADDEVDDDLNSMVEQQASMQPPGPTPSVVAGNADEEFSPSSRLAQVRSRAGEYEREYRLGLLHRLLMRGIPIDEIASQLGISVSQVYRDRSALRSRLRDSTKELNIEEIIGDSKGFYDEVSSMAMRAASNSNVPMPMRLAGMRTALAAKNDMHRFFQTAGVYDALRFRVAETGQGASDVRRLMDATERILSGLGDLSQGGDSGDSETVDL